VDGSAPFTHMIEPLYFGDPSAPLFGVLNRARPGSALDRGVLICAPLGYENVIYYRQLAILARRLSDGGKSTFRFDWPGCGDSAGDDRQPGLIAASLASVGLAVAALRAYTGVTHVDVVGLRVGATLAAAAIAGGLDVEDVVLWDPFTSGRAYVRAMRAFDRLSYGAHEVIEERSDGGQPASGFILSASSIEELGGLDLLQLEFGAKRRLLIAGRDGPPEEALVDHYRGQDHDVTTTVFEGLREAALGWTERPVPTDSFARIEAWLSPGEPLPATPAQAVTPLTTRCELTVHGAAVSEESVLLADGSPMLGVAATPAAAPYGDAWVVFLPNRYARRIGPNRLYTEWARAWAAAGVPSLRIDVSGTGDAGGPDEETDRDMYRAEAVNDVLRSVRFLRERYDARRFAVMGLCSGGYIGFHAALDEPAIVETILLNPQMLLWTDQETAVTRAGILRRGVVRPSSWRKLFVDRGALMKAVLPVVGEALVSDIRWRFGRLLRRNEDRGGKLSVRSWIIRAIDRLESRRCAVVFVFSEADPGVGYLARHLGKDLTGLAGRPGVAIETVDGADHTFRQAGRQAVLRGLLEGHLAAAGFSVGSAGDTPT